MLINTPTGPGFNPRLGYEIREEGEGAEETADQGVAEIRDAVANLNTAIADRHTAFDTALTEIRGRLQQVETIARRPGIATPDHGDPEAAEYRQAFASYLRRRDRTSETELRALVVSNDPQGGYLAPAEMSTEFIRDLTLYSPIRSVATARPTSSPSVKYTKRTGISNAQWGGEGDNQPESTVTFGQIEIPTREVNTHIDISNQLLADSAGQAEAEVRQALAEDFGRKEGLAFISGDNTLAPEGILTNTSIGYIPTGASGAFKTDDNPPKGADCLIDLMYALPAFYRNRATWVMNGKTLAAVRKLKDGQGAYIWQASLAAGSPETILGRPVLEAPDMPDLDQAGNFPIVFGDFATGYRIVDRLALSILVNPFLLATKGLTRIHATRRVGAAVIQPAAIKKLKSAVS
jgi:HK97 family phage major capsid protein